MDDKSRKRKAILALSIFTMCDDEQDVEIFEAIGNEQDNAKSLALIELDEKRRHHDLFNHKIYGFVQHDVPRYNDPTFKAHFRLERSTFESLLDFIAKDIKCKSIPPDTKLLATLWLAGNGESYRGVADRFGMSKGTLHFVFIDVCGKISGRIGEIIQWPSMQDMKRAAEENFERCKIPGVVGYVDGCHVPIKGKSANRDSFINRKGFSSVIIQGVSSSNLEFIHSYVGWAGSVHDARVYRNSDLFNKVEEMPKELHLLGDSAYPLQPGLLTPYRDNGHLTATEQKFNVMHSSARSCIERAFGLLKTKFRRLKYLDMSLEREIPDVITTCMVLHNFILMKERDEEVLLQGENLSANEDLDPCLPVNLPVNQTHETAAQKRKEIADNL